MTSKDKEPPSRKANESEGKRAKLALAIFPKEMSSEEICEAIRKAAGVGQSDEADAPDGD